MFNYEILHHFAHHILTKVAIETDEEIFIIWSFEHEGWWKPNRRGYTHLIYDAGLYSRRQTSIILENANWEMQTEGYDKQCHEVAFRVYYKNNVIMPPAIFYSLRDEK